MAVATILFFENLLGTEYPSVVVTASTTASGYSPENVRDVDYALAWKPANGTNDEYVQIDLGSAKASQYCVIGYDARASGQSEMKLMVDAADNPAGAFATLGATFTINFGGPTCDWKTTGLAAKRYYRLYQFNATRSGVVTCPVYFVALYATGGVDVIDTEFTQDAIAEGAVDMQDGVGIAESVGAHVLTNVRHLPRQAFEISFDPATTTLWKRIRDQMFLNNGRGRAWPVQFEGLRNYALEGFQIARVNGNQWTARRVFPDEYATSVPLVTEPFV